MIDSAFRTALERFCKPIVAVLDSFKIAPNSITVCATICSAFAAYLTFRGWFICALLLWIAGRFLDGIDGIYARAVGRASAFGGFLDIVGDMFSYGIVIVAFSLTRPDLQLLWILTLFGYTLCISSALALGNLQVAANSQGRHVRLARGLAEAGETNAVYILFWVFPAITKEVLIVWVAALLITVVMRISAAFAILR